MRPSTRTYRHSEQPGDHLELWVRGMLLGIVVGLLVVFGIAIWLNPYQDDGSARAMETHRQLGLPPCTFNEVTGIPCPACGMTTSFSLLVRGDLFSSMRANWVGTMLAIVCLAFIPWAIVSVVRGRPLFVRSLERTLIGLMLALLVLMMLRWAVVVGVMWASRP